jgi:photosystem II stability/assembly factor-like uncharacterized protein
VIFWTGQGLSSSNDGGRTWKRDDGVGGRVIDLLSVGPAQTVAYAYFDNLFVFQQAARSKYLQAGDRSSVTCCAAGADGTVVTGSSRSLSVLPAGETAWQKSELEGGCTKAMLTAKGELVVINGGRLSVSTDRGKAFRQIDQLSPAAPEEGK